MDLQDGDPASNGLRIEVSAFQEDLRGFFGDARFLAPDDAGDGDRALGIGNHENVRAKPSFLTIQSQQGFSLFGASDHNEIFEFLQIKGVERMPPFQEYIVGDIHHIVDRPEATEYQSASEPGGRRPDLYTLDHTRGISWTPLGIVQHDPIGALGGLEFRLRGTDLFAKFGGDLPGHSDDPQEVRTVRCGIDLKTCVV